MLKWICQIILSEKSVHLDAQNRVTFKSVWMLNWSCDRSGHPKFPQIVEHLDVDWNPNHFTIWHCFTIQILDFSGIWIPIQTWENLDRLKLKKLAVFLETKDCYFIPFLFRGHLTKKCALLFGSFSSWSMSFMKCFIKQEKCWEKEDVIEYTVSNPYSSVFGAFNSNLVWFMVDSLSVPVVVFS